MSRRKSGALRKETEYMTHSHSHRSHKKFYQPQPVSEFNSNVVNFNPQKQRKTVNLVPKTVNQESYILALQNEETDVVVVSGPAGTGKTYLAILAAIQAMRNRECDRIVLCRPSISIEGEDHGFLPGDINAKMEPWTRPLFDVLREYYSAKEIAHMLEEQIVEIAPLAFCRGRNFKKSYVILDEAQNCTPSQLKMIMTRIGIGSKIIITGDIDQGDRKTNDNGLLDLQNRLKKTSVPGLAMCHLDMKDVQRHNIIEHILKMYQ